MNLYNATKMTLNDKCSIITVKPYSQGEHYQDTLLQSDIPSFYLPWPVKTKKKKAT